MQRGLACAFTAAALALPVTSATRNHASLRTYAQGMRKLGIKSVRGLACTAPQHTKRACHKRPAGKPAGVQGQGFRGTPSARKWRGVLSTGV